MESRFWFRFGSIAALTLGALGCSRGTTRDPSGVNDDDVRRIEAFQARNRDWAVHRADDGNIVATSRWSSCLRDDIRPEVEAFLQHNAADLGLHDPAMRRVTNEPTLVRYEPRPRARHGPVEARLSGCAIVVTANATRGGAVR